MKKNSTKGYVLLGISFALVSIIAFAVPTAKTATFWIAYVFTAAAFAAQIGIWKTALGKEGTLKSKFLGFPIVHIGIVYAIIQVIALQYSCLRRHFLHGAQSWYAPLSPAFLRFA